MGTNIYLVKQIKDEDVQHLRSVFEEAITDLKTSRDAWKVRQPLEEELERLTHEIHICKVSYGYQVLFQSHTDLYDCTWKSMTRYIRERLKSGEYIMRDEYGAPYSLKELKQDVEFHKEGKAGTGLDYVSDELRWIDNEFF